MNVPIKGKVLDVAIHWERGNVASFSAEISSTVQEAQPTSLREWMMTFKV